MMMMTIVIKIRKGALWGSLGRGGKERTLRCEEDESMLHIDT
jgi:hypothetical protein